MRDDLGMREGSADRTTDTFFSGTAALAEGIQWGWESFPEYLDALERMPRVTGAVVLDPAVW